MGGLGPLGGGGGLSAEQQYALKWNDFHSSILSSFRHLRDEEDFIDVTLACEGCSFTAHKVVLSACSPYFRTLLKANPCQHPIVILRDVREKDMEALLRFMYNGEVNIGQEQLPDFLKTAQTLQVRGLAEVSTKDSKTPANFNSNIPWSASPDETMLPHNTSSSRHNSSSSNNNNNNNNNNGSSNSNNVDAPPHKKSRMDHHHQQLHHLSNSRYSVSPPNSRDSKDTNPHLQQNQQQQDGRVDAQPNQNSNQMKSSSAPPSQLQSSNEDSNSYDDEASDADATDNGINSISDLVQPKLEPPDFAMSSDRSRNDSIVSPSIYDHHHHRSRSGGYPSRLFDLQGMAGLGVLPGPSGMHNNNQDAFGLLRGRHSDTGKVRATDPRPCPKCGKIYRSAHTLRTHLEDKHTICPGYRCVLCGTVAKSRNSLHSHMSRQHRGISTKDLPVLPMPSPFDPELASKLYLKAGVKMSPAELRARASPTGAMTSARRDSRSGGGAPLDTSAENNNCSAGEDDPQDLSINSGVGKYMLGGRDGLDYHNPHHHHHHNKINNSLLVADKGGGGGGLSVTPVGNSMLDAYFQMLADGNFMTPEQAVEMTSSLSLTHKDWPPPHAYPGASNNNDDNECTTSEDEGSLSGDDPEPIKAE